MRIFLIVLGLWLTMAQSTLADTNRVISVNGTATIDAVPDMATITLGVTQEAPQANVALAATSKAVAEVIARLQSAGVAERDMQTRGLSLQPVWSNRRNSDNEPPKITGFVARNALLVRVRDLAALGMILDRSVQDGANSFDGLQFGLQNPDPLQAEARKAAVRDAMARAAQLAEAAGVTLGPIQSISESGSTSRPMQMEMASARMSADVPIAAGEVGIQAQVSMVFEILD